jgi:predicted enzyme related to lactoylglutathione lyase
MPQHEKLDYVEFPARGLSASQIFFNSVFGRGFENFGPDDCAFSGQGLDGDFYRSKLCSSTLNGSALLVFYSDDLQATLVAVEQAVEQIGGRMVKPIFDFPGGGRFHFSEPSDDEFAVWSALAAK